MHLLFDLVATQPLSGRFHGGAEYCKAVFRELIAAPVRPRITAFFDASAWLDPALQDEATRAGVELVPAAGNDAVGRLLAGGTFDRFYSALPYDYRNLPLDRTEFVFTIHGLRPIELPTDSYEDRYERSARVLVRARLKQAFTARYVARRRRAFAELLGMQPQRRSVIVPSLHTKYALLSEFPTLDAREINVLYSPARPHPDVNIERITARLLEELHLAPRGYFLILSANRWVKNAIRAIEGMDRLFSAHPQLPQRVLVLGAAQGALGVAPRNPDRFVFRDYAEAAELEALYGAAFALVFPTLNEGFGYPPLEAMRHGTPVIASAVGPTTEVCGDAALYVNPYSPDEIRGRALMLALEPELWNRLSLHGRGRSTEVGRRQASDLQTLVGLIAGESVSRVP